MIQWDIWNVKQQHARKTLVPTQPNDSSNYDRMYVIVADLSGRKTAICCPIQNLGFGAGITEVPLPKNYAQFITKDSKIVCHDIFTLPVHFFDKKVGFVRPPEQDQIQTALILVFDLT